jgi:hypothetical protein
MATPPPAAASAVPSYELFLASARSIGAVITDARIHVERAQRRFGIVWTTPGKSAPPKLVITTPAGPLAQPPAIHGAVTPRGGPFRGEARPRIVSPAPLTLRLETKLDRTGKSLRINRETQTGDAVFDERVYVESEATDALVLAALASPITRENALKCLESGCASLTLDDAGDLGAELPLTREELLAPERLTALLDTLGAAAEAIPPLRGSGHHRTLAGVLPTLAVTGTFLSWPLFYLADWLWEPIDYDLYPTAALGGAALWVVSLPFLVWILRGRSVSLRNLVTCVVSLAIGLPLGGTDLLLIVNGALDTSTPVAHETQVKRLHRTTGKHSTYHVTVASWRPGEETTKIPIGSSLHATLTVGEAVTVTTRRGFLGWERMTALVPSTTAPQTSN